MGSGHITAHDRCGTGSALAHVDRTPKKLAVKRGGLVNAHFSACLLELLLFILKEVEGPAKDGSWYKQLSLWPFISGCGAAACAQGSYLNFQQR